MAFTFEILFEERIIGSPKYPGKNTRVVRGTFTNTSGSTGGDIHPKLSTVKTVHITPSANSSTDWSASITSSASGFTLTSDANVDGFFEAFGFK